MQTVQSQNLIDERIESVVKPLNNKVRLRILLLLAETPLSYSDILDELQIESGSFYWHIKKMPGLIQQHTDKKYSLTNLGYRAYDLIMGAPETVNQDIDPLWYIGLRKGFKPILSNTLLSVVLLFISIGISLMMGTVYDQVDHTQFGLNVSMGDLPYQEFSIIVSVTMISIPITSIGLYSRISLGDGHIISKQDILRYYCFTVPMVLISMLPGFVVLLDMSILGEYNRYLTVVLATCSIFITILLLTILTDITLGISYKNSLILQMVVFYPVVLVSYALT